MGLAGGHFGSARQNATSRENIRTIGAARSGPLLTRLAVGAALREDNTGWHGMRVGVLTRMLAMARGFSSIEALEIGLAAQLHDIGMLGVPESAMIGHQIGENIDTSKIQTHCDAGADILCDDRHPRILMARDIAQYHHALVGRKRLPCARFRQVHPRDREDVRRRRRVRLRYGRRTESIRDGVDRSAERTPGPGGNPP